MPNKAKYDSYQVDALCTERFFRWAYKARLWPQLIGLVSTGLGAYLLFLYSLKIGNGLPAVLALVCLYLTLGFGLLILRSVWRLVGWPVKLALGFAWVIVISMAIDVFRSAQFALSVQPEHSTL